MLIAAGCHSLNIRRGSALWQAQVIGARFLLSIVNQAIRSGVYCPGSASTAAARRKAPIYSAIYGLIGWWAHEHVDTAEERLERYFRNDGGYIYRPGSSVPLPLRASSPYANTTVLGLCLQSLCRTFAAVMLLCLFRR